jgi:hypothetical protein
MLQDAGSHTGAADRLPGIPGGSPLTGSVIDRFTDSSFSGNGGRNSSSSSSKQRPRSSNAGTGTVPGTVPGTVSGTGVGMQNSAWGSLSPGRSIIGGRDLAASKGR